MGPHVSSWDLVPPEGVLDLFAGLLEVGPQMVPSAFSPKPFVTGSASGCFLASAVEFLGGIVDLVSQTHRDLLLEWPVRPYWRVGHVYILRADYPERSCPGRQLS